MTVSLNIKNDNNAVEFNLLSRNSVECDESEQLLPNKATVTLGNRMKLWVSRQWSTAGNSLVCQKLKNLAKEYSNDNWEIVQFGNLNFVKDRTTNKLYRHNPDLRRQHLIGLVKIPIFGTLMYGFLVVERIAKLLVGYHFWQGGFTKANFETAGKDLLRVIAAPIGLIGLEAALIIGLINPNNGRKLINKIEDAMSIFLAPESYYPVNLPAQQAAQA